MAIIMSTEFFQMILPLIILQFVLMTIALIDLFRSEETKGPKWIWALVVIFVTTIGPIVYFIFGRRN